MERTQEAPGATAARADAVDRLAELRLVGSGRVLVVLEELARHPDGVGLERLTRAVGSPEPTVHRALGSLRRAGLAGQDARGHHVLGDEFLRMAFAHHEGHPDHVRVRPVLESLADGALVDGVAVPAPPTSGVVPGVPRPARP